METRFGPNSTAFSLQPRVAERKRISRSVGTPTLSPKLGYESVSVLPARCHKKAHPVTRQGSRTRIRRIVYVGSRPRKIPEVRLGRGSGAGFGENLLHLSSQLLDTPGGCPARNLDEDQCQPATLGTSVVREVCLVVALDLRVGDTQLRDPRFEVIRPVAAYQQALRVGTDRQTRSTDEGQTREAARQGQ